MAARKLHHLEGTYAVARLEPTTPVPPWADGAGFVSITRTDDELSIVCRADRVPQCVQVAVSWACFKLQGPFAFDETGVVLSVIEPLSKNGVGIFVVSTYDGDHILVQSADVERSVALWQAAGHLVTGVGIHIR
jgi:hypothetical protein